ncbi:TPRKB protein [Balamuthia mandrillaris]
MTEGEGKHFTFDLFPDVTLRLFLFRNVRNMQEIMQKLLKRELELALMSPSNVCDEFQILVAANRAVHSQSTGKLSTNNIHSELVYNLSGAHNISEALRKFGMSTAETNLLVGLFNADEAKLRNVSELVQGEQVPLSELSTLFNLQKAKKVNFSVLPSFHHSLLSLSVSLSVSLCLSLSLSLSFYRPLLLSFCSPLLFVPKNYKLSAEEERGGDLVGALVTRIAGRGC